MQDEAAELIDNLVTPTEVKLNGLIPINNTLHTVAHVAPVEVKMQHNLYINLEKPPETNKKPAN